MSAPVPRHGFFVLSLFVDVDAALARLAAIGVLVELIGTAPA